MRFYNSFKGQKKREVKESLLKARRLRKEQIILLKKVFVTPQKDNLKLIDKTLKNEVSLEEYLRQSNALRAYMLKTFEKWGKAAGKKGLE